MPKINVLIYTDSDVVNENEGDHPKGVRIMKRLMKKWQPAFADLEVSIVNRFEDPANPRTLTFDLLKNFHQIWFFGLEMIPKNGKDHELDAAEIKELKQWMSVGNSEKTVGGGILISGDHSEKVTDFDVKNFRCLGRALGQDVPRAHQLRGWEGAPTNGSEKPKDRKNLLSSLATGDQQDDEFPMPLMLKTPPHPLFLGRKRIIDVFPDHGHEGRLLIPDELDDEWPALPNDGSKPRPEFIAYSSDRELKQDFPVLSAYDGDPAGVGRIVADSSWHHYMNVNLCKLDETSEDSAANLLGQYYSNLAVWLAPLSIRKQMAGEMFVWLANHTEVWEERENADIVVGSVALHYLRQIATGCEIEELRKAAGSIRSDPGLNSLASLAFVGKPELFPSKEALIGAVVSAFHRERWLRKFSNELSSHVQKTPNELIEEGVRAAFEQHAEELSALAEMARINLEKLKGGSY